MTDTDFEKQTDLFEQWAEDEHLDLSVDNSFSYNNRITQIAWFAWLSSLIRNEENKQNLESNQEKK